MKKSLIFILSLALFASCSKNPTKADTQNDSVTKTDTISQTSEAENGQIISDTLITREVDMRKFPVEFQEEFTNENQKLLIQLKNTRKGEISGQIITESNGQNIRFNNIELNNQSIDGPFGRDFNYTLDEKDGYRLIIGKSLMADGNQKGKFTVKLK